MGSLVQNQVRTEEAAGNSWRDHLQRFKMLDPHEQFRTICGSAGFIRPVSVGMYCRTSDDMNDGFGNLTASCREKTPPRAHQDSVVKLWIQRYTEIGPVLELKTFCHLDVDGIEIQIPSTSPKFGWSYPEAQFATWMSYDTRIQINSPENFEEADYGATQEINAEQPTVQSRSQCSSSDDHIPIHERKWEDISANEHSHEYDSGHHVSDFFWKIGT